MIQIIRNLLPQDTRIAELSSAYGIISIGIFALIGISFDEYLTDAHPIVVWIIFCGIIGSLQLWSLISHPKLAVLRVSMAWVTCSFWLWVAFSSGFTISAIACFWLGISNAAAFIINIVILSEKWKL